MRRLTSIRLFSHVAEYIPKEFDRSNRSHFEKSTLGSSLFVLVVMFTSAVIATLFSPSQWW